MKAFRPVGGPSFKVVLSRKHLGKTTSGEVVVDWSIEPSEVTRFTIRTQRKVQKVEIYCTATGARIMEHFCASPTKFIMDLQFENVPGACEYVLYGYYLGSST